MSDWVDRSERRLGWLSVPNLPLFLAVMNGVVGVLSQAKPEFPARLALDPDALRAGEAWRALTFLLVPPPSPVFWLLLWLVVFYAYSSRLERAWGEYKFTVYALLGAAGSVLGALLTGRPVGNSLFQTTLFLAFARVHPNFEVLIFFFFPARMRWLAIAAGVLLAFQFAGTDAAGRAIIALSLLNYALFFGPEHVRDLRWAIRRRFRP